LKFFSKFENLVGNFEIFNSSVNRDLVVVIACFVLHNCCEMWKIMKLCHVTNATRRNNLTRFKGDRLAKLSTLKDGKKRNKKKIDLENII
jgi:hypothetical protein